MGGNSTKNYADFSQNIANQIYNQIESSCRSRCDNNVSGISVTVINSTLGGGIAFDQLCRAEAKCTISQDQQIAVQNIAESLANSNTFIQNSLIGIGGSKTSTEAYINQRIRNQISQVITSSCSANVNNILNNTVLYVAGSKLAGGIQFTQDGSATADCAMNNVSRMNFFNKAVAESDQRSNIVSWAGGLGLIVGIIVIVAIIALALVFVIRGPSLLKNISPPAE